MPHNIHPNQKGYMKDCFIGKTVQSIFNVMDLTVKENIPG